MQEREPVPPKSIERIHPLGYFKVDLALARGDLSGGIAAALVALPQALGKGALVFLPLGLEHVHVGIVAGLYAAIAGGLVAALIGRPQYQISGPITSAAVISASLKIVRTHTARSGGAAAWAPTATSAASQCSDRSS